MISYNDGFVRQYQWVMRRTTALLEFDGIFVQYPMVPDIFSPTKFLSELGRAPDALIQWHVTRNGSKELCRI